MDAVLIYTDSDRIEREKDLLDDSISVFQAVYNALIGFGITVTLTDVNNLISWTKNGNGGLNFEQEFVINKLLDAATYNANGVSVTRDGMRSIMQLPDVTALKNALAAVGSLYSHNPEGNGIRINLMTLLDDVIAKAETAYAAITSEFTYYTKSDASATLATSLLSVCAALNTHDAAYKDAILRSCGGNGITPIRGISIIDDQFVPALGYIRSFEQTGSV